MEARSERVSLKPPMDGPTIAWSHEAHIPRSYHETKPTLTRHKLGSAFLDRCLVTADGHMKKGA
jgi:hypothetical protein